MLEEDSRVRASLLPLPPGSAALGLELLAGEKNVDEAHDGLAVSLAELFDGAKLAPQARVLGGRRQLLELLVAKELVDGDLEGVGEAGE